MRLFGWLKKKEIPNAPPEPGFMDAPEGFEKMSFSVRDFFGLSWVRWGAGLLVLVIVSFFGGHRTPKEKSGGLDATEENRTAMTAASMERAIDASSKSKETVRASKSLKALVQGKRKLDSAMGVFVFRNETHQGFLPKAGTSEKSRLGLASGTKIPAVIEDRLFSFNVEAPVVALVPMDFPAGERVVIPRGSKFLGEANVLKSLDRINVRFHLLVFPDGREVRVNALALSEDGAAGIRGRVEKHTDMKMAKAVGESLLSMGTLFLGGRSQEAFSLQDQLELNLAQNLSDEARKNMRTVNVEKSVTVEASKPVFVFLLEAL